MPFPTDGRLRHKADVSLACAARPSQAHPQTRPLPRPGRAQRELCGAAGVASGRPWAGGWRGALLPGQHPRTQPQLTQGRDRAPAGHPQGAHAREAQADCPRGRRVDLMLCLRTGTEAHTGLPPAWRWAAVDCPVRWARKLRPEAQVSGRHTSEWEPRRRRRLPRSAMRGLLGGCRRPWLRLQSEG